MRFHDNLKTSNYEKSHKRDKASNEGEDVEEVNFSRTLCVVSLDVAVSDPKNDKRCFVSEREREGGRKRWLVSNE